jgi:hypothetical protein
MYVHTTAILLEAELVGDCDLGPDVYEIDIKLRIQQ